MVRRLFFLALVIEVVTVTYIDWVCLFSFLVRRDGYSIRDVDDSAYMGNASIC